MMMSSLIAPTPMLAACLARAAPSCSSVQTRSCRKESLLQVGFIIRATGLAEEFAMNLYWIEAGWRRFLDRLKELWGRRDDHAPVTA